MLQWLRDYLETLWKSGLGKEFVRVAPLNSMASNIGGFTLRGRGEVPFKDARGTLISWRSSMEDDLHSSILGKCGKLRFTCVDEVEAAGAETTGKLEGNVRLHISANDMFKYIVEGNTRQVCMFGGVNALFV